MIKDVSKNMIDKKIRLKEILRDFLILLIKLEKDMIAMNLDILLVMISMEEN